MKSFRIIVLTVCFCCVLSVMGNRNAFSMGLPLELDEPRLEYSGFQDQSRALSYFIVGIFHDSRGETLEAVSEYQKALEFRNDIGPIYTKLGADFLLLSEPDRALVELDKALQLDPLNDRTHLLIALVYMANGEYDNARICYERVLERDPENLRALTFLSDLLMSQGQFDEAVKVYEKMLRVSSDDTVLYFNLGMIYSKTNQLKKAEQSLKKAIEIDSDYAEAQMVLGLVYEVEGNIPGAIKQYEAVETIDPTNKGAYARAGQLYYTLGKEAQAIEQFRMLGRIDPENSESYLKIFGIYVMNEEYGAAEEILQEALTNGVMQGDVYAGLGYLATVKKQYRDAVNYYKIAIDGDPENNIYWFYLGVALNDAGEIEQAISVFEERVSTGEASPDIYNCLGYIYAADGVELDRAIALITKALVAEPENGAYNDSLGWVLYKKGMYPEALGYITKAVEYLPQNATIQEHLGDVYLKLGNPEEAEKAWREALGIVPGDDVVAEKLKRLKESTKGGK